jgi:hypothetical protein
MGFSGVSCLLLGGVFWKKTAGSIFFWDLRQFPEPRLLLLLQCASGGTHRRIVTLACGHRLSRYLGAVLEWYRVRPPGETVRRLDMRKPGQQVTGLRIFVVSGAAAVWRGFEWEWAERWKP